MEPPVSLTTLYPSPRPVTLAGRTFLVSEMTIRDAVDLQDYLDRGWENPLEAIRPSLAGMEDRERMTALRGIWDAVEAGPPRWGTSEAARMFAEPEGIMELFRIVLRTHHPEITLADMEEIASRITAEEYGSMIDAWRRVNPADELEEMLGMRDDPKGKSIGWAQVICEICETYHWTIDDVASLTFRQIATIRRGGKPKDRGVEFDPRSNWRERHREMRAKMGMNGHASGGNPDGG